MGLYLRGLITRIKKKVWKRAIAVLIEIRFSFPGYVIVNLIPFNIWNKSKLTTRKKLERNKTEAQTFPLKFIFSVQLLNFNLMCS